MKIPLTLKSIDKFEALIKKHLGKGMLPDKAVHLAYKEVNVMDVAYNEIKKGVIESARLGYQQSLNEEQKNNLLSAWAPDKLTLSERTTKGNGLILSHVKSEIKKSLAEGDTVKELSKKLFDGYKEGGVIPQQIIPKFMFELKKVAFNDRASLYKYRSELKKAERYLKKVNNTALKTAYNEILIAIDKRNEEALNKAIYVATQERTRYFAERIARTESARAYNEGVMARYEKDEDIVAYKWTMSSRHPCVDICDLYANADLYGMGNGVFPKDKVPMIPAHPHCMCMLKPVEKGRVENEDPKDQIENGGKAFLQGLSKREQERLLGVAGTKAFQSGESWQLNARGLNLESSLGSLIREAGISHKRISEHVERNIDRTLFHSSDTKKELHGKFKGMCETAMADEELRIMLTQSVVKFRGSDHEQLGAFDLVTGERLYMSKIGNELGIDVDEDLLKKIIDSSVNPVALFHNHSNNLPPSVNDIIAFLSRNAKYSFVMNNLGEVYRLAKGTNDIYKNFTRARPLLFTKYDNLLCRYKGDVRKTTEEILKYAVDNDIIRLEKR